MKRFRIVNMNFDSRALTLSDEIRDEWEEVVKEQHRKNRERIIEALRAEYGTWQADAKIKNFTDLGPQSFSVFAFHNRFLTQARAAFVVGAYYPAATGACALGERILNHLILRLRDHYAATPDYKKVHAKDSFDDWRLAIDVLEGWGVLLAVAAAKYRELHQIRNFVLHFNLATDMFDRDIALACIQRLDQIIAEQFPAIGAQPWFIPGTYGEAYIRKESEGQPFVKEIYLPNCQLVGPRHRIEFVQGRMVAIDDTSYDEGEISDAEFISLRRAYVSGA